MRGYAYRKQTRDDFTRRIRALDGGQNGGLLSGQGKDTTEKRPLVSLIMGFSWFYIVVTIATNRDKIEASLAQGSLPAEYHSMVFSGLAALLTVSGVYLLIHLFRLFTRAGAKRANSTGLVSGAALAVALIYTPPSVVEAGLGMIDENSRSILTAAQETVRETVPGVDFGSITLVSSTGQ